MSKADWIWMPHSGHFILGRHCEFHLNTYVDGFIVSTVGEYNPDRDIKRIIKSEDKELLALKGDYFDRAYQAKYGFEEVGCDRLYETLVFEARKNEEEGFLCCPYLIEKSAKELDFAGYNSPQEAYRGHIEMCYKWDDKVYQEKTFMENDMGLGTTHNAYRGSYTRFKNWRESVAKAARIIINEEVFEDYSTNNFYGIWEKTPDEPLMVLLIHHDHIGAIFPAQQEALAKRLQEIISNISDIYEVCTTNQFIYGLRKCFEQNIPLEFF